jgi:hypothetical protein
MTRQGAAGRNLPGLILSTIVLAGCLAAPSVSASPPSPPASSEPVRTSAPTPTASPTSEPTPDQTRVPILAAGAMAATRTTVRVRDLPGTQWGVTALLAPSARVQVVLGPVRTADFGWYLVRDADTAKPSFTEGWLAAGFAPDAFIAADPSAKPPPNGPAFVAGYAGLTNGDFGPFRVEGNTALRWALALPIGRAAGSICRFTGTLTPAGGKAVVFLKTSASDAPAPGTVQPSFFAQHPTLRGDLFLHVESDCSWAVSVARLPL